MKIALLEPIGISESAVRSFAEGFKTRGHEFTYYNEKTTDVQELKKRSNGCDIVMIANNPYPSEVIKASKQLKMLSVAFTGVDHIDGDACKKNNVMICNAAGYSNETVAELIIAMAINALRNIAKANATVRKNGTSAGFGGREIYGRTIGIIGLGRIGMRTAELFQAFGAKVIAYSRSQSAEAIAKGIEYRSLEEVLSESDIISLNLPLNPSTKNFINADRIALMKKEAVFINCARGPIVDNDALAKALNEEKLAFACIDVFDMEPPIPSDYALLNAKNTLLTPHIAFISEESMLRRAEIVFHNVYSYLDGSPINVCN